MAAGTVKNGGPNLNVFVEYLVYLVFRLAEEAICLIREDGHALAVGRFFGRLMFMLGAERRQAALENITIAFGKELGPREIRLIALKNFEHLGMLGVEFFRIRRWSQKKLAEKLILRGKENFDLAWLPSGKGILYVTAHFGSFEVLAAMSRFMGIKGNLVVTPAPNRFVNERMFFRRGGDDSGLNILPHRGIVHHVVRCLREGQMVVVLADQRGDDARPVWVDYFGTKVLANGVFARFAAEGAAYVFPVVALRTQDGRYRCVYGDEIPIQRTHDKDDDLMVNSQRFHQVFEAWLREYPEQGFWMHRKFKRKSGQRKRIEAPATVPAHRMQYDV
jgi:KDO2-lipid IV(A) lauroyltransferase